MQTDILESAIQVDQARVAFRLNRELLDALYSLLSERSLEAKDFFEKLRTTINECLMTAVQYRVQLFERINPDDLEEQRQPTREADGTYHGFILNLEEFMVDPKRVPLEGRLLFETNGRIFGIAFPFGSTTITATKGAEFVITQGSSLEGEQVYSQILIQPVG